MGKRTVLALTLLILASSLTLAYAKQETAVERGKEHFNNPAFAGGKKSCNTCHPNGSGLKEAGTKTKFNIMGKEQGSLAEAINFCIVYANKGNAIDVNSPEMQELKSYIISLGAK